MKGEYDKALADFEEAIANDRVIDRSFQVPAEVCSNSALVSAERDGYSGLRRSLVEVFSEAVSSIHNHAIERD